MWLNLMLTFASFLPEHNSALIALSSSLALVTFLVWTEPLMQCRPSLKCRKLQKNNTLENITNWWLKCWTMSIPSITACLWHYRQKKVDWVLACSAQCHALDEPSNQEIHPYHTECLRIATWYDNLAGTCIHNMYIHVRHMVKLYALCVVGIKTAGKTIHWILYVSACLLLKHTYTMEFFTEKTCTYLSWNIFLV